jgi:hypothetical protein
MTPSSAVQDQRYGLDGNAVLLGNFGLLEGSSVYADPLFSRIRPQRPNFQHFLFGKDVASVSGSSLRLLAQNINRMSDVLRVSSIFEVFKPVIAWDPILVIDLMPSGAGSNESTQNQLMRPESFFPQSEPAIPTPQSISIQRSIAPTNSASIAHIVAGVIGYFAPLFHIPNSSCNKVFAQ